MKLKGFMATLVLIGLMVFGSNVKVNAIEPEEVVAIEENKSELATWFDEDLKNVILDVTASLSGAALAMGLFLKSIKTLTDVFKKSSKDHTDASETMKYCEKEIRENNLATKVAIEASNKETLEKYMAENEIIKAQLEKLNKALQIAFTNDSKLVKNGAANEIMKVLGDINENTEA